MTLAAIALALLACGSERWEVKVLADAQAAEVDLAHPREATVARLASLPAPAYAERRARAPEETQVFVLSAFVLGYKLEEDGDIHIVVSDRPDGSGATMVAEIPSSDCLQASRARGEMDEARRAFLSVFQNRPPGPRFRPLRRPQAVQITGVGFFDKLHGQTGAAPNGIELHPVLSVAKR